LQKHGVEKRGNEQNRRNGDLAKSQKKTGEGKIPRMESWPRDYAHLRAGNTRISPQKMGRLEWKRKGAKKIALHYVTLNKNRAKRGTVEGRGREHVKGWFGERQCLQKERRGLYRKSGINKGAIKKKIRRENFQKKRKKKASEKKKIPKSRKGDSGSRKGVQGVFFTNARKTGLMQRCENGHRRETSAQQV